MERARALLIWLCCALVLCTGAPLQAQGACRADRDATAGRSATGVSRSATTESCCGTDACCCASGGGESIAPRPATPAGPATTCDCGDPRSPERAPPTPGPRLEHSLAPAPMPVPAWPVADPDCRGARCGAASESSGPCPGRSRQEVLSVWLL